MKLVVPSLSICCCIRPHIEREAEADKTFLIRKSEIRLFSAPAKEIALQCRKRSGRGSCNIGEDQPKRDLERRLDIAESLGRKPSLVFNATTASRIAPHSACLQSKWATMNSYSSTVHSLGLIKSCFICSKVDAGGVKEEDAEMRAHFMIMMMICLSCCLLLCRVEIFFKLSTKAARVWVTL